MRRKGTTPFDGRVTEYDYDAYNQLTAVYCGGRVSPVKTITYSYDNAGNMLAWSDGASSGAYTHDGLNRVQSETTAYPFGISTISYARDNVGNRLTPMMPRGSFLWKPNSWLRRSVGVKWISLFHNSLVASLDW
ncbi:MAG: hypothetical protein AAB065_08535 [Deltaproteobacteria bacterium]